MTLEQPDSLQELVLALAPRPALALAPNLALAMAMAPALAASRPRASSPSLGRFEV